MTSIWIAPGSRIYNLPEPLEESIVKAYEEKGIECVKDFNGAFAFGLRNEERERIFIARDRYGIKPLYYSTRMNRILYSDRIKSLLEVENAPVKMNYGALAEYLTFQNIFSDRTLFNGVRMLPGGCYAEWDYRRLRVTRYWDYSFGSGVVGKSKVDISERIRELLVQAVSRQVAGVEPLGCYLSGGMDTGSIVAMATQYFNRLLTFSCGFDTSTATGLELGFDERVYAERLANLFKTEHYEVVLHAGDMEAVMPQLMGILEEPRMGQCYPDYYTSRLARKFVDTVLSGSGGDELFGGYPWRYYGFAGAKNRIGYERSYYDYWQRLVPDDEKILLFLPDVYREVRDHNTFDVFRSVLAENEMAPKRPADFINLSMYLEIKTFLPGLFVVGDKIAGSHGLETRYPFMDNDLVDFAMSIPVQYKMGKPSRVKVVDEDSIEQRAKAKGGKLILREAMRGLIPDEILERGKQGFSAPDGSWYRGDSMKYVRRMLENPKARIYEYLNRGYVKDRVTEHLDGKRNHRLFIWSLLSLEWWLRSFL